MTWKRSRVRRCRCGRKAFRSGSGVPGLATVTIPVLIANGDNDHPYVATDGALAAAIPGAQLVRIPGVNHITAIGDPRLKAAVVRFLNGR